MNRISKERLFTLFQIGEDLPEGDVFVIPAKELLALSDEILERRQAEEEQKPIAWIYEWASCITTDGPQNFREEIDREPPPSWAIKEGQARKVVPLYAKPVFAQQQTAALNDVIAERQRQITDERWTLKHDDGYTRGPLALAAAAYALMSVEDIPEQIELSDDGLPTFWPWDEKWFKPTAPRRNLVKAAALILAEIERIDRAEASNDN